MYQYILIYEYVSIVQTSTYQYVLVCPRTRSKKLHTRSKNCIPILNPQSSAYYEQNLPLSYGGTDLDSRILDKQLSLYIYIVAVTRLVCAPGACHCLITNRRCQSHSAAAPGHDIPSPSLD